MNLDFDINNDANLISNVLDIIFSLIEGVVKAMKEITLFRLGTASVSLFNFCIALTIMSIVITYLVNVAKRPNSGTSSEIRSVRERREK